MRGYVYSMIIVFIIAGMFTATAWYLGQFAASVRTF